MIISNPQIEQEIGSGADGIIFSTYDKQYGQVILKRFKNKEKDEFYANFLRRIRNEVIILSRLKQLIHNKICPNYAYMFKTNIKLGSKIVLYDYNYNDYKCSYIMQCKYDITLQDFLKTWHPFHVYKNILFQIIYGLYVFQKYLHGTHNDLLGNNIFIKYIDKDVDFLYFVDNNKYLIKTYGYHVVIGDFGLAKLGLHHKQKSDFGYLARLPGIISYYNDTNDIGNVIIISMVEDPTTKLLVKKLRRYDKTRPVERNVYLHLYEKGEYVPALTKNYTILINKLTRFIASINMSINSIKVDELDLRPFYVKNNKSSGIIYEWSMVTK